MALLALLALPAFAAPPAVDLFFKEPLLAGAELSPSGRHVAMLVTQKEGHNRLAVLDVQTMQSTLAFAFKDGDIDQFHWVNDDRLVVSQTVELTRPGMLEYGPGLFAVQRDGSGFKELVETGGGGFVQGQTIGRELLKWNHFWYAGDGLQQGDSVLVWRPDEHHLKGVDYVRLLRLNTLTGRAVELDAPPHSFGWAMDAKGEPRVAVTEEGNARAIQWRDPAGRWVKLDEGERFGGHALAPLYLAADGTLYVSAGPGRDTSAVYTMDPATRKLSDKPVLASAQFDLHPRFIVGHDKLLGIRYAIDASVTEWLDPALKAAQAKVDQVLPATVNEITPPRRAATPFVLVKAYSDSPSPIHYQYNAETGKFVKLGAERPGLDAKALGVTEHVRYKARDGLEIPAWLTLPPGEKKGRPLVVLVHGGPWTRGRAWGFDADVQFLASRGYAVLEPEFRGSTGFGEKHFMAGWKQWGRAMQDDLADGVKWAVSQGHADAKRVCIGGASYGGYAALMGLIRDPDLYRCGFEWVGVTDLNLLYDVGWSDASDVYKKHGMPMLIGDREGDAGLLKAASPLAQVDKLQRPLLMAHGRFDVRVPVVHGEKLRDALKARGAEPEWVVYDEGHGWSKAQTKLDFWTRVEKFLDKHIGR
jgi:acetyl esterase/lipase